MTPCSGLIVFAVIFNTPKRPFHLSLIHSGPFVVPLRCYIVLRLTFVVSLYLVVWVLYCLVRHL